MGEQNLTAKVQQPLAIITDVSILKACNLWYILAKFLPLKILNANDEIPRQSYPISITI
jgi:hypothetical protein